jgi:isochorismate synthase EntC
MLESLKILAMGELLTMFGITDQGQLRQKKRWIDIGRLIKMQVNELDEICGNLLDTPEYRAWIQAFPVSLRGIECSEREKLVLARLLAFSIANSIEMATLCLSVPGHEKVSLAQNSVEGKAFQYNEEKIGK